MGGFWAVFWLVVVLKIPLLAMLWIIWWAITAEPQVEERPDEGGGSDRHRGGRPRRPRPPRRDPHADPPPAPPSRVRVAAGSRAARPSG